MLNQSWQRPLCWSLVSCVLTLCTVTIDIVCRLSVQQERRAHYVTLILYSRVQYELAVKDLEFVAMVTSTGYHAYAHGGYTSDMIYCKPEMRSVIAIATENGPVVVK